MVAKGCGTFMQGIEAPLPRLSYDSGSEIIAVFVKNRNECMTDCELASLSCRLQQLFYRWLLVNLRYSSQYHVVACGKLRFQFCVLECIWRIYGAD